MCYFYYYYYYYYTVWPVQYLSYLEHRQGEAEILGFSIGTLGIYFFCYKLKFHSGFNVALAPLGSLNNHFRVTNYDGIYYSTSRRQNEKHFSISRSEKHSNDSQNATGQMATKSFRASLRFIYLLAKIIHITKIFGWVGEKISVIFMVYSQRRRIIFQPSLIESSFTINTSPNTLCSIFFFVAASTFLFL